VIGMKALVCGITSRAQLHQDLAVARNFQPMTEAEILALGACRRNLIWLRAALFLELFY